MPDGALLAGDLGPLAHLGGVAAGLVEGLLELVVHPGQVNDDAGADAVLQGQLGQGVAVAGAVDLFLVQGVVGGVAVGGGMQGAGVGVGTLVEALQILAAGEVQVRTGAGERPQGGIPAPGLRQIPDLGHLVGFQIQFFLVERHIGHDDIPPSYFVCFQTFLHDDFKPWNSTNVKGKHLRFFITFL